MNATDSMDVSGVRNTLTEAHGAPLSDNARSVVAALRTYGGGAGLRPPHRYIPFLAQLSHESGGFRYDRELWGPTAAQKRYDTRTDLGNTPERDGDGYTYRGRGPIQVTGRHNYREFTEWCEKRFGASRDVPDFVRDPDALNTDPWEGLAGIWYWDTRGLNQLADRGAFSEITRRINGGTNGLADRRIRYTRYALIRLGFGTDGVSDFQRARGLFVDGLAGPKTRMALHYALRELEPATADPAVAVPARKPLGFWNWLTKRTWT